VRILFWGTPDFAVPPLRALIGEGHDVVGVVTQPDKPRGRSRTQLDPSPVKQVALEEGIPVLQPDKPRGDDFADAVRALEPDISVVVAYGRILPKAIIDLPRLGTLNIHGSILPALRGAAPIQAAILEGMTETGVTIMQMVPALDAGDMLHVLRTAIEPDETYSELHDRLSELGAMAIVQALAMIDADIAHAIPQDESLSTYASKIDREMARLDFTWSAERVSRVTRAFDARPGAYARLRDVETKFFSVRLIGDGSNDGLDAPTLASPPGTVRTIDDEGMLVRCGEGAVRFLDVQPSGKPRMTAASLARGRGVSVGDLIEPA
jgi:methionyl-tRNA formyltransferase